MDGTSQKIIILNGTFYQFIEVLYYMLKSEFYRGQEQTYVKHFFLENYLEKMVSNICSSQNRLVYVDGFSGPWKLQHQDNEDTSFKLTINKLRAVKASFKEKGIKIVRFKCLFFEKDPSAFKALNTFASQIKDINIKLIHGSFENHIDDICEFVGTDFSLIFVDPTTPTDLSPDRMRPLFQLKGEILINFMPDFMGVFFKNPNLAKAISLNTSFGPNWFSEWKTLYQLGLSEEAAAIEVYTARLKKFGNFEYATSTRILKLHTHDSFCYFIYATNHWSGILEFRKMEKKNVEAQEKILQKAKVKKRKSEKGMDDLFAHLEEEKEVTTKSYEAERSLQHQRAREKLMELVQDNQRGIFYEHLLGHILEMPLVWKDDLDKFLNDLKKEGKVSIPSMAPGQRKAKNRDIIFPV